MKHWLRPNISRGGRLLRALLAVLLLAGAWFVWPSSKTCAILLAALGVFVLFEALRGWCALRACGIKTRL